MNDEDDDLRRDEAPPENEMGIGNNAPPMQTRDLETREEGRFQETKQRAVNEIYEQSAKEITSDPEEDVVPPVKEIRDQLSNFEMKVPVWGLTVFTVDGYIIAHKLFYDAMPEEIEMAVSSMSAGLITISEDFIRMVDSSNKFRQVLVDSEDTVGAMSFSILLRTIAENVLIACIFPDSTQLGLVVFEIENLSSSILEIVSRWDVKLNENTVT